MRGGALADILSLRTRYDMLLKEGLDIEREARNINYAINSRQRDISAKAARPVYGFKRFLGLSNKAERENKWATNLETDQANLRKFTQRMGEINAELNTLVKPILNAYAKEFSKYGYTPNQKSEFLFNDNAAAEAVRIPQSLLKPPYTPITNSFRIYGGYPKSDNIREMTREAQQNHIAKPIVFDNGFKNYDYALRELEAVNPTIANPTQMLPTELPTQQGGRRRSRSKRTRRNR
jgi:hypothetical protein